MVDESIFYDSFEDIFKTLVDFVCVYKRYVNVNCRSVRMHKRCKIVHSHLLMKSLCSRVHRFLGATIAQEGFEQRLRKRDERRGRMRVEQVQGRLAEVELRKNDGKDGGGSSVNGKPTHMKT